jgi:signal transduction histidine kinase
VLADPDRLAQALDNMIDNALRHGGLRIAVEASVCGGGVRITVSDSGRAAALPVREGDARHGHGLRIISAVAAEHGGRFDLRRGPGRTEAVLELPLAPSPLPVARRALAHAAASRSAPERPRLRAVA